MKAARVLQFGPPSVIENDEVPRPEPAAGELLVRVKAAGVCHWEALARRGKNALHKPLPVILGSELSGIVEQIGAEISGFKTGDEVYGAMNDQFTGAYAECAVPSAKMMSQKPRTLKRSVISKVGLLPGATALLCCFGCRENQQTKLPPAPLVEVATVTQADVPIYHEWIGVLDGLVNAQIRAQVTGYLLIQNYREGDPIRKGDMLFEIDPRPFQATLDQAKGVLAQAEARYGKTQLDVKRYAPLVKDRAISQEEYDDAVQADLEAKAAVVAASAQVEQAQLNLGFTRIASPIDGIASIARAQIGDLVGPGTGNLTTVSTIDPIKAYYQVTEQAYINFTRLFTTESNRYERLKQLETQLILTDGKPYPMMGTNFAVDREIGATTGSLRVEALFPNPNYTLRPGQFAHIRLKFDTRHNAILVPQRAVSELQGSYQVAMVEAENKIHIQQVQVGERSGAQWIIESGLHPGDRIVVEGAQKVREGASVVTTNFVEEPTLRSVAQPNT